ncbi:MAG: diguanylate cyclase, partial [Gammaproteobacteria bacterium]|nr:diguanylate cyclase [Gammaproteobacteria bacterium]
MNNVDLPVYLKNSKLLNNLTVQRLLKNWAIVCSVAVIGLSLTAVITNDIISSKQDRIDQAAFAIESGIRHLGHILIDFELRRSNILSAATTGDLDNYVDRSTLEQGFNDQLAVLSSQTADLKTADPVIRNLKNNFQEYLVHDAALLMIVINRINVQEQSSHQDNINENEKQAELISSLYTSSHEIRANMKRLSDIADDYVTMLVTDSRNISQINLFIVATVSLIVIAIIAAGISLVIYRIDEPLSKVRAAMHDLSHGDMTRRLKESTVVRDEFSDLSVDFNRFAVRTQLLFDEVTDAKDALEDSERRTRAILENALVGIAHLKDRRILSVNRKFEELFGYARHEIEGMHKAILYPSADDYKALNDAAYQLMANGDTYHGEWKMKHKDGNHFWCEVSAKSISDNMAEDGTIWLFEDITQRKRSEEELRRLANFDTLTGLPNRALFHDRLDQGLERAKRQNGLMALIYIDLDRFKKINDSFGHSAGDELLIIVSKLLCECVRVSDSVSRLGGDEFTIILPELQNISDAGKVAEKIITMMDRPLSLKGKEITISPSLGISIYPNDAKTIEALLQNADSAMYHAKSKGRNNYQYYTQEMNAEARHRLDMESKL